MKYVFEIKVGHNDPTNDWTIIIGVARNAVEASRKALAWAKKECKGRGPHRIVKLKLLGELDFG